ncbi:MAG: energy-coupling factor transporter ATPase [Bacilli bacterium]|nr:energy-coupling factor transporter ATPase [Bacilli bacterium]
MALLEIKNLSFTYSLNNSPSIKDINLKVNQGDFIVVCGSTGSGKSTLLKMFKNEIRPKGTIEGSIFFKGKNLDEYSLRESVTSFGMVMQNTSAQIVNEMVYSELAFGLENLGVDPADIAIRVAEIANYFGINNWYNKPTSSLSGGEKQILNLASILVMNPEVLLIDEPTSQVDPITAAEFLQTLKKLNQDFGLTIILIEHRLDELFTLSDRIIIMDQGSILADSTPREVASLVNDERLYLNLPLLLRISKRLNIDEYALSVKEGQNIISKFKNEIDYLNIPNEKLNKEVIELKNIYFKYNREDDDILEDLSLKVFENEIFTILGSNGSGKSTLLKVIAKLNLPYYGKVYINGKNIKKIKDDDLYYKNIAYLPQNPADILFSMSVSEELDYYNIENDFILNLIKKLEIESLLDKHPDDLSGGEIQKVAFIKILLQEPKIILLDEPTKGLDAFLKVNLIEILKELKANNITIIIVSHDLEFSAKVSSRVGILFAGNILSISHPNTFFSNNFFYTTITNKITRGKFKNAVTEEDLIKLIELNGGL